VAMERLKMYGISFRSVQHFEWFTTTLQFFAASIFISVISASLMPTVAQVLWGALLILHFVIAVAAVFVTKFGKVNGPTTSVDCVWFNGVVAAVYAGLIVLVGILF